MQDFGILVLTESIKDYFVEDEGNTGLNECKAASKKDKKSIKGELKKVSLKPDKL